MTVMRSIWRKFPSEEYDIHTFEELPLKIKNRIIRDHEIIWTRNSRDLEEYLHKYRRIWNDQSISRGVV